MHIEKTLESEDIYERKHNGFGHGIDGRFAQATARGTRSPSYSSAIRVVLYAVLAVLRPFIVAGLSALTLVGLAMRPFFTRCSCPGAISRSALVLIMSVASAVLIVLFYALMEFLLPQ